MILSELVGITVRGLAWGTSGPDGRFVAHVSRASPGIAILQARADVMDVRTQVLFVTAPADPNTSRFAPTPRVGSPPEGTVAGVTLNLAPTNRYGQPMVGATVLLSTPAPGCTFGQGTLLTTDGHGEARTSFDCETGGDKPVFPDVGGTLLSLTVHLLAP